MHGGSVIHVEMVLIKEDRGTTTEKQSTVIKLFSKYLMRNRKSYVREMASSRVRVRENSYMDDH
jgi:hypothetical protein